ncbi:tRNA (N(6)-L-threonylcarbamoyladenosine(37)-C(2))-methylthiotransferase MtaB [Bartonella sp. TP]|uniref:tRNA (N(6)-L-threonylcarbamoyladenosine(37)-C(2))- methylthiotransferase MtaB n=1 Tax=Bartonella sp. TP TaxID=3057550 RepID=UPI0025B18112|nr:tRNA (N(6)-L-threonylcarbamoyladenosine(37)-C(2))-methylthiotransferase MtaB [Bartonella sp. TP]MDN5248641.1 tRNA (N(6)-L-threonylcarbamoyladenosine(37)-C(2))-methylthiotransferase MtaB [Alphaproteobacteria bacterium]WJW79499.1 tRNA (N(6)-L-threonylcarbamoyladenosine(37)-C(2))-methylthiotransferase MtaB [Bartonella sp. TP]
MATEIVNFGCRLNSYEAEIIRQKASQAGLDEHEVIIFNSCAVTKEALRQAKQSIRKAARNNSKAKIIVTGCGAQTNPELFSTMPEVSFVLGNAEKLEVASYNAIAADFGLQKYEKIRVNDIMEVQEHAPHLIDSVEGKARAFVQIQNGCDHRCTFCIIPFGRGPSRSVPIGAVVRQIEQLCTAGYKEIVLTGVDLTSYGADLPIKSDLGILIQNILQLVPQLPRLRLSSIDSIEVNDLLFELLAFEPRLMPHLHLSLQAGDNLILKRMKRRHLREDAIAFCTKLKEKRPEIIFGADLIAGFPTETEEMFNNSLALIKECGLTYLHIFPFSAHEQVPASKMPQIAKAKIKARAAKLRAAGEQALQLHLASKVGKIENILVESNQKGRGEDYSPVKLPAELNYIPGSIVQKTIIAHDKSSLLI